MYQVTLLFKNFQWPPVASGTQCKHLRLSLFHSSAPHLTDSFGNFFHLVRVYRASTMSHHWARYWGHGCEPVRCPHGPVVLIGLFGFSLFTRYLLVLLGHLYAQLVLYGNVSPSPLCPCMLLTTVAKTSMKMQTYPQAPHPEAASRSPGGPAWRRRLKDL